MKPTIAIADQQAGIVRDALAGGSVRIYSGTQPATPETAVGAQTLLAEVALDDPSGTVANGTLTFTGILEDADCNATGDATWARFVTSLGGAVLDASIGPGADIDVPSGAVVSGMRLYFNVLTYSPLAPP